MTLTPKQGLRLLAGLGLAQAVISGFVLLAIEHETTATADKARFLVDIVSRNVEHLDDFDLIALRELGVIREVPR